MSLSPVDLFTPLATAADSRSTSDGAAALPLADPNRFQQHLRASKSRPDDPEPAPPQRRESSRAAPTRQETEAPHRRGDAADGPHDAAREASRQVTDEPPDATDTPPEVADDSGEPPDADTPEDELPDATPAHGPTPVNVDLVEETGDPGADDANLVPDSQADSPLAGTSPKMESADSVEVDPERSPVDGLDVLAEHHDGSQSDTEDPDRVAPPDGTEVIQGAEESQPSVPLKSGIEPETPLRDGTRTESASDSGTKSHPQGTPVAVPVPNDSGTVSDSTSDEEQKSGEEQKSPRARAHELSKGNLGLKDVADAEGTAIVQPADPRAGTPSDASSGPEGTREAPPGPSGPSPPVSASAMHDPGFTATPRPMTEMVGGSSPTASEKPGLSNHDNGRFLQRVTRAFEVAQNRGGLIRLRLSPPELGALRLEVRVDHGVLTARVEAEAEVARTLLLDNMPALRERLADQGIRIEQFDVDLMDQGSGSFSNDPSDHSDRTSDMANSPDTRKHEEEAETETERAVRRIVRDHEQLNIVI